MRRFFIRWFLPKSNIHEKNNDQKERVHECNIVCKATKVYHVSFRKFVNSIISSLKYFAVIKERIPRINLNVNNNGFLTAPNWGSINTLESQTAAKFTNNSENTSNQDCEDEFIYLRTIYPKFASLSTRKKQNSEDACYKLKKK